MKITEKTSLAESVVVVVGEVRFWAAFLNGVGFAGYARNSINETLRREYRWYSGNSPYALHGALFFLELDYLFIIRFKTFKAFKVD